MVGSRVSHVLVVSQPGCLPRLAGWTDSLVVYSAGIHVCLRLRNACLSARA